MSNFTANGQGTSMWSLYDSIASWGPLSSYVGQSVPAGTSANFSANLAFYVPIRLPEPMTVIDFFVYNGTAVAGNVDVGLYTWDGRRIASSGAVAQSGTSVLQILPVTDFTVGRGQFYLAVSGSNAGGTYMRGTSDTRYARLLGAMQEASAHPLPTTATFATGSSVTWPYIGMIARSI